MKRKKRTKRQVKESKSKNGINIFIRIGEKYREEVDKEVEGKKRERKK
jgi:hypothetical protein